MGCASSSPLMNGGPGGLVETSKNAANDVMHSGEELMHDVGENMNEKITEVKEMVVGAVQNVGHGLDNVFTGTTDNMTKNMPQEIATVRTKSSEMMLMTNGTDDDEMLMLTTIEDDNTETMMNDEMVKYIPLKDTTTDALDDKIEEFKQELLLKSQSLSQDTVKMADDLIKETDDVMQEMQQQAENTLMDNTEEMTTSTMMNSNKGKKTPTSTNSMDSLKTGSPEPEIERILSNSEPTPPTPQPTMTEELMNGEQTNTMQATENITSETEYMHTSRNFINTLIGNTNTNNNDNDNNNNTDIDNKQMDINLNNDQNDNQLIADSNNKSEEINNTNTDDKTDETEETKSNASSEGPTQWERFADEVIRLARIRREQQNELRLLGTNEFNDEEENRTRFVQETDPDTDLNLQQLYKESEDSDVENYNYINEVDNLHADFDDI